MTELSGKIALVTGASRGIGRATALRLGTEGALVAVHYNASREAAEAVVAEIAAAGGKAFAVAADLGDPAGADRLFAALDAELRHHTGAAAFDILVNNAGRGLRLPIEEVTQAQFDRLLQIDLKSPFFIIKHASPRLRDGGRIINVSSMSTRAAYPLMAAYASAKAGLEALTLSLAAHFGPRGITVNAVLPGATATDMNAGARDPVAGRRLAETIALGRVGEPEDIAEVIAFLASERGRWITGQRIDASGGQRI